MDQKLQNHWNNLIRPLFKDAFSFETRVVGNNYKNFEIEVFWIINNDSSRPNKPSKTLRIVIPWETIIDYHEKAVHLQDLADEKIIKFISSNLKNFEPNHNNPRNMQPPEEVWIVTTEVL